MTGDEGPDSPAEGSRDSPPREQTVAETPLAERIEALHRAATDIGAATTAEDACRETIVAAADILEFELSTVVLHEDGLLVPKAISADAAADGARPMEPDQGNAGQTFQTGESLIVDDIHENERSDPSRESYRSVVSVPVGDHGVFQAVSEEVARFDEQDLRLAELLVSHTASTLDRIERERRLREKNRRLENFAGLVSHDLRNPLSVAAGHAELAMQTGDFEHVETVVDAIDDIDEMIDNLLVLAREGDVAGETERIDLEWSAHAVWGELETAGAALDCDVDCTLNATQSHLHHLLGNLFRNAVEHGSTSNRTGSDDAVEHAGSTDSETMVTVDDLDDDSGFYVADDGPGIPPEHRDDLFEPGYSTDADGTGFGLCIVEEVGSSLGWDVSVTESDAGGARFEIRTE
jgi:signal transduction histidine kinase